MFYADKLVDTFTSKIVPKGFPIFWWNKNGVYDGNNKKFLVEGDTPAVKNEYTVSSNDTYSCNYVNSKLSIKQVRGLSLGPGSTLQDDAIKKASQATIYYSLHPASYRHSMSLQKNDTEWYFDLYDVYLIFIKIDWETGTLMTSSSSTNSNIIGYDLLYTDN